MESTSSTGLAELMGNKELDDLSQLQREKFILEQEIREQEESLRKQNTVVQDRQNDLDRECISLQGLKTQKQDFQERLEKIDQQRSKLEGMLNDGKEKCQEERQMAHGKLSPIAENQKEVTKPVEQNNIALKEINGGNLSNLPDGFAKKGFGSVNSSFKSITAILNNSGNRETAADLFQTEEPFKFNFLDEPLGGDLFKESHPFKGTSSEDLFKRTDKSELFGSSDPFSRKPTPPAKPGAFSSSDLVTPNHQRPKDSVPVRATNGTPWVPEPPVCTVVAPPPYSYGPNGSDLPRDRRVVRYFYNLGVKWYRQRCGRRQQQPAYAASNQVYYQHYTPHAPTYPEPSHAAAGYSLDPPSLAPVYQDPPAPVLHMPYVAPPPHMYQYPFCTCYWPQPGPSQVVSYNPH